MKDVDDQDGREWVFLLVPVHPGSPGQRAIKSLCVYFLKPLLFQIYSSFENVTVVSARSVNV